MTTTKTATIDATTRPVHTRSPVDERLEQLQADAAAVVVAREAAERDLEVLQKREEDLSRRITTIQVANTALRGLPAIEPDREWLKLLKAWRKTLADELLALPERPATDMEVGQRRNLTLSIATIDRGPSVLSNTGYDLTTLRLGRLMRDAGYEPLGGDPRRFYSGVMPWFGTIEDVEERIAAHNERRAKAQAQLDQALAVDAQAAFAASP